MPPRPSAPGSARRIGALRHRLVIEQPLDIDDGAGGATRSYAALATVFAAIETLDAQPALMDNRPGARRSLRILVRWRADLDCAHRLRLGPRLFFIRAIADADDRRRRLALLCEEETP
jgi:SPP1 family predicted phage head-tail adaptor